ncbi:hypothetical protein MY4038_005049 [Beauveria bassiana]|uniref:Uncharacterized protein n=1 Tax=Beauveria bassiana TaxID=176275 RepID=A0A2N6P081_BEABA|nr:hypothetical protein BM221_000356 [Beauveria bassiana]PQK08612.1 hypothetical protein BB8028_0001g06860 [Beauveria bassiana]
MTSSEHNEPFEEGKENSHSQIDPKDQRSIANRLAAETVRILRIQATEDKEDPEVTRMKEDPTAPAREHGNEPSRGAKIDAQIQKEEQAELERKGKA